MGSFERRIQRRQDTNQKVLVPLLNEPTKQIEVPVVYRDRLLKTYGVRLGDLAGIGFHIVFVLEGVVFGILSNKEGQAQVILHLLTLDDLTNIELVGAEIYDYWVALKEVLSYEELKTRYNRFAGNHEIISC